MTNSTGMAVGHIEVPPQIRQELGKELLSKTQSAIPRIWLMEDLEKIFSFLS